jgi:monoamine oxidase
MIHDTIIIGTGISGLFIGIELKKRYPEKSCCILEKYGEPGGRINTFRVTIPSVGAVQWESGAGRIATSHKKTLCLLKKYGLHTFPIPSNGNEANPFELLQPVYFEPLKKLPEAVLQTHTLYTLLKRIYGERDACEFAALFPYSSEIHTLRADRALISFENEMNTRQGFVGCQEGIAALTDRMAAEFCRLGGSIQYHTAVDAVNTVGSKNKTIQIAVTVKEKAKDKNTVYTARDNCIVAVPSEALKAINGLHSLSVLKKLSMQPLLRIYAVFPTEMVNGKKQSWFSGIGRIVTDSPIRYFIPINPAKGIAMISYTDGADADTWMSIPAPLRSKAVIHALRILFPGHTIPEPLYMKEHHWKNGCTYWLPGKYSVRKESDASVKPFRDKNIYLCGESFAENQCWIESALQQAQKVSVLL